jgi:hypothetical protein
LLWGMVTKWRGPMTRKSTLLKKWYSFLVKQPSQVPCSSTIFLSVSVLFGIGQVQRSFTLLVRYIPEWFPWLRYKLLARYGYDTGQEVLHGPMEFVRETMVCMLTFKDVESSLFASSAAPLNRHLLSRICKRRRNSRNQNAKRRRK